MSYFYLNKLDGSVQWTLPESTPTVHVNGRTSTFGLHAQNELVVPIGSPALSRDRSDSAYSRAGNHGSDTANGNVYSDDSDVEPHDRLGVISTTQPNSVHAVDSQTSLQATPSYNPTQSRPSLFPDTDPHLTSAEKLAQALQHALAPPLPDSLTALSALTRQSVAAIVTAVQSHDSPNRSLAQASLENRIADSVIAIRHLLYISSPPYGHVPSHLYHRDGAVSSPSIPQTLQAQLKPAQRRVTATLSKLVLAALAAQYDTKSFTTEVSERMETDAAELDRALVTFVTEVQKINGQLPHEPSKRLFAALLPTNVGLGLMGAGAAGGWKGFGWVGTDAQRQPRRDLSTYVLADLKAKIAQLEEAMVDLHSTVFEGGERESLIHSYAAQVSHIICSPSDLRSGSDRDCVAALGAVVLCGCEPCTHRRY
jgi:son of sevenless-like protein